MNSFKVIPPLFLLIIITIGLFGQTALESQPTDSETLLLKYFKQYQYDYRELQTTRSQDPLENELYNLKMIYEWMGYLDSEEFSEVAQLAMLLYAYDQADSSLHCFLVDRNGLVANDRVKVELNELRELQDELFEVLASGYHEVALRGVKTLTSKRKTEYGYGVIERWEAILFPAAISQLAGEYPNWLIHPTHNLGTLPWYALSKNERILVQDHTIHILEGLNHFSFASRFGASHWESPFAKVNRPINPIIIGNPDYSACSGLDQLQGAEREVRYVADKLNADYYVGEAAVKDVLMKGDQSRLAESNFVYLATHAIAYPKKPKASHIYFASQGDSCSYLNLIDFMEMKKLEHGLVILSACETGQGMDLSAGTVGLARSFLLSSYGDEFRSNIVNDIVYSDYFGAQNVFMSLWNVNDLATEKLMKYFMDELLEPHGFFPAEPLRRAILTYMQDDPNPMHWAAFLGMGVPFPVHTPIRMAPLED